MGSVSLHCFDFEETIRLSKPLGQLNTLFPAPGQKPYPCAQCDAFFSTKSNCERHLLRKHGVANLSLRRNGLVAHSKESDAGSHDSTGSAFNKV